MHERLEKWMDSMGIFLPSEDVNRLLSNEKLNNILKYAVTRIVLSEKKKLAERLILLNSLSTDSSTAINNITNISKRQDLIKRHVKLKTQLKEREQDFVEKQKTYSAFVQNIQTLIQEIQLTNCAVDEERKKSLIMLINKKELQSLLNHWNTLQEVISGIKEIQNLKWRVEKEQEWSNVNVMDVLDDCQCHIAAIYAETNKKSDSRQELKRKTMKKITSCLQGFSWQHIFDGLMQQEQKLNVTIEALSRNVSCFYPVSERRDATQISLKTCSYRDFSSIITYQLYRKKLRIESVGENECSVLDNLPLQFPKMEEDLKLIEFNLCDTEKLIQKGTEEFMNMKAPLRKQMNEVSKIMSQIKQFLKHLEESIRKYYYSGASVNELHVCMKQLTAIAPNEIKLFSEIPLVFLEKLHLLRNKSNEGHKLMLNFQKMYPYIQQFSKNSLDVLDGSASLNSRKVVLYLFQQIGYLQALSKIESVLESIPEGNNLNFPFNTNSCADANEKLQKMLKNFTNAASVVDVTLDDVSTLVQIWCTHPLNGIVPKNLVVDGSTFKYWENKLEIPHNSD